MSDTIEHIDRFLSYILANRWNAAILERIPQLRLADWWLTAGCLAQSVWNGVYNRAPDQGILDYDIFYSFGRSLDQQSWKFPDVRVQPTSTWLI